MKPLVIVTTFNRKRETEQMLTSLLETTNLDEIELALVDNGSTDGTYEFVKQWWQRTRPAGCLYALPRNIGCPRALNQALGKRQPGQPVVKLDNDLKILSPGWVQAVGEFVAQNERTAMVGAWYEGFEGNGRVKELRDRAFGLTAMGEGGFVRTWQMNLVIGHAVWHTGEFMDQIGYFDVLAPEHLYGFEDLILSAKAAHMEWPMLVWEGWAIENIQRANALGRQGASEQMRPLYNERVRMLANNGCLYTGSDGRPI